MPPPGHPLESAPTDTPSPTTMSTDSDAGTREGALAAVDLGSNSFHMIVAESLGGEPLVIDRLREQVQLGAGLDAEGRLDEAAIERGLACLQLFGQRLRHVDPERVRVVGTNTLRVARNARDFIERAEETLGHPIEIISGREEARLIYLGVAHTLSDDAGYRLVVDIGGGSTECILGERFEALDVHSLYMGCVAFTQRFFPDGKLGKAAYQQAELAARLELQTVERRFREVGWASAVWASGTIKAVAALVAARGWCEQGISLESLQKLRKELIAAADLRALEGLPGVRPDRLAVLPGGAAILMAVFEALGVEHMHVSNGALKEGLIYDLLGRIRHEDVRERTIRLFQQRYHVDTVHANRVRRTALLCLGQVAADWGLTEPGTARMLAWACAVHEVGLDVAWEHYHRHGAYVLGHADMPGFSRDDQALLAALVGGHRRKLKSPPWLELPPGRRDVARKLTVLLRLAVLLNRGRVPQPRVPFELHAKGQALEIHLAADWLEAHPLTRLDLEAEAHSLRAIDLKLKLRAEAG